MNHQQDENIIYYINNNNVIENDSRILKFSKVLPTVKKEISEKNLQLSPDNKLILPFPPYKVHKNYQIFISLVSIFCEIAKFKEFTKTNQFNDGKNKLMEWMYYFFYKYPDMPSIYVLILLLGFEPDEIIQENNKPALKRLIIHNFIEQFKGETLISIEELSTPIPQGLFFKNINSEILVFAPILTSLTSFSVNNDKNLLTYKLTIDENDYLFYGGIFEEDNKYIVIIKKSTHIIIYSDGDHFSQTQDMFNPPDNCIMCVLLSANLYDKISM